MCIYVCVHSQTSKLPCERISMLAGHSLGGAMANLAAVDIVKMMDWASVKVYTVGAPRAGNHAYAKMYNKLVPDTWSIINYKVKHAVSIADIMLYALCMMEEPELGNMYSKPNRAELHHAVFCTFCAFCGLCRAERDSDASTFVFSRIRSILAWDGMRAVS